MFIFDPVTGTMVEVLAVNQYLIHTPLCDTLVYVFCDDPQTGEPITYNHCLN